MYIALDMGTSNTRLWLCDSDRMIAAAIREGADYVKLFPADQLSEGYVRAVKAPLSDAKLLAVGGVNESNAADLIQSGFSGVGVGSNLYDRKRISSGDWAALEELAKKYVYSVKKRL